MSLRRPLVILALLLAATAAAACGVQSEPGEYQGESAQLAETEGIYVHVDELKYQVQVSKQLNPALIHDRDYLEGVSRLSRELSPEEEWFAVFILVQNYAEEPIRAASQFVMVDTQGTEYRPVPVDRRTNVFAYRSDVVQPKETLPHQDDPAAMRFPNGSMLLFKVRRESLDNRPLELVIRSSESGEQAIVNLDV